MKAPLLIFSMLITDTLRCTPPTTHARTTHAHNSPGASRRQLTSSKEILAQHNSPSSVHKSGLTNCESLIQSHLLILRVLTSQTSQTLPGTRASLLNSFVHFLSVHCVSTCHSKEECWWLDRKCSESTCYKWTLNQKMIPAVVITVGSAPDCPLLE